MSAPKHPSGFTQFKLLLGKDLRQEFRTREMLTSMGLYAFLVLIVLGAAFSQVSDLRAVANLAGGLVWVIIVFAALLGLGRAFAYEKEGGAMEGMLLAPVSRGAIYLAKFVSNLVFLSIVEIIVLPLFYFFFLTAADPSPTFFASVLPILLGTVGISAVGTLLATITSHARSRDVLLAVLFIPVLFPLLYSCVAATTAALGGVLDLGGAFGIGVVGALGYDIIFTAIAWLLYDYVVG
ncbi:MAG: heme exporter protein CcmB [Coriobacteriia bacterium]|nr:heme exporter protein CcmB [Coriobacteriia bacterium]